MKRGVFSFMTAAALVLAAHSASAKPVRACPDGQAVHSLQPNGTPVSCIPVPAPVDLAPLQAQIGAEAAARAGMDATLMQAINQEAVQRRAADDALRASIPAAETSIVGRYAFTGTQACLSSSNGFDPVTFFPILLPAPPPPLPGLQSNGPVTVVTQSTATSSGFRTFNADGTGTVEFFTHSLTYPSQVFSNVVLTTGATVTSIGLSSSLPAPTTSTLTGTFAWRIEGAKLIIDDGGVPATGIITSGGVRVGWTTSSENVPPIVGVLGKDLRIISMVHEATGVEIGVTRSPAGQPVQEFRTPRVCHRERTLRKVEG